MTGPDPVPSTLTGVPGVAPALTTGISPHEAAAVCGYYGLPGGYTPSGFIIALIHLIVLADATHLGKLASVYPGYVAAVRLVNSEHLAALSALAQTARA